MKVIGLAGWSGAGKTTLPARLIPHLIGQGLRVSTVKHAHHGFDVDTPGKDSWMHREAGASVVDLTFASALPRTLQANVKSKTTLESYSC